MPPLLTRKIGNDDVPAIGYGAMGISAYYGSVPSDEDRLKFLDEVFARGCTHWDTANVYADSEELIGKWLKKTGKRGDIFLATKFGLTGNPERWVNGEPEAVKASLDVALEKLGVDFVDLFYLHRPDQTVPIEVTVGAMADQVKAGKTRYLGLSECCANDIRRAHAVHPIAAVQVEYSLFEFPPADILEACRELNIAVVAYSPLGRGLLTGKYKSLDDFEENDFRRTIPRFQENFSKILDVVDGVAEIAKKYNATSGQIALAWLLAQGDNVIPIPGTRSVKYLEENLGALRVKLSPEDVKTITALCEKVMTYGLRYDPGFLSLTMKETPRA